MVAKKLEKFTRNEVQVASLAQALSHPARLRILRTLAKRQSCVCGELVKVIGLSQSTVSQHLKALSEAGLIAGEISGPNTCYCIDWRVLKALRDELSDIFGEISAAEPCSKRGCC